MAAGSDRLHWVPEATALHLCGVKRATWAGWGKQGVVDRPEDGAYGLDDVLRVALAAEVRKVVGTDDMAAALRGLDAGGVVEEIFKSARDLKETDQLDLVIEPESGHVTLVKDNEALAGAVRHPSAPRRVIVVSPASELCRVIEGFANRAKGGVRPAARRPGRPRGIVTPIQEDTG
jgi:hypothetical protein